MTEQSRKDECAFDLSNTPSQAKGKVWRDTLNEFYYDCDIRPADGFDDGSFNGWRIGNLQFASFRSDAVSVHRTPSHVARDPHDFYFVLLPRGNEILLSQRDGEARVANGQFSLVSAIEPYSFIQNGNERYNSVVLPGQLVRQFSPRALDKVAKLSRNNAITRLFINFTKEFCENIEKFGEHAETRLCGTFLDLFELVLNDADASSTQTSVRFAHRTRIQQAIEEGFRDPSFGIARLSETLKISTRYIHQVFSGEDGSVSDLIRKRRIKEACRLLAAYGSSHRSISTVAYQVGFTNLSHFSRVFKDEVGCPPSDYSP